MVALLVLFTIVACLVADGILMSVRERRTVAARDIHPLPTENMIFAQDGGVPREPEVEKDRNVLLEDLESGKGEGEWAFGNGRAARDLGPETPLRLNQGLLPVEGPDRFE